MQFDEVKIQSHGKILLMHNDWFSLSSSRNDDIPGINQISVVINGKHLYRLSSIEEATFC